MTLTITDTRITSDEVTAYAEFRQHAAANGHGGWVLSTRGTRLFNRNQAISAMTIEEEKTKPLPNQALIASLESELH
jgi:hypothetical protein